MLRSILTTVTAGLVAGGLAVIATPVAAGGGNGLLGASPVTPAPILPTQPQLNPKLLQPRVVPNEGVGLLPMCPDPAIVDFALSSVSRYLVGGWPSYNFRITATVRNVGGRNYTSGAHQQSVVIYRQPSGGTAASIGEGDFTNLGVGAQIAVTSSLQANWTLGGEFLPSFKVRILYDPDIHLDGNPNNDDCSSGDNFRTLTGEQIGTLLMGYTG